MLFTYLSIGSWGSRDSEWENGITIQCSMVSGFICEKLILLFSITDMVVKHCCYGKCKSDNRDYNSKDPIRRSSMKGVFFIPFPKPRSQPEKCARWIRACAQPQEDFNESLVTKDTYICCKHFVGGKGATSSHPDPIPARYCKEQVSN